MQKKHVVLILLFTTTSLYAAQSAKVTLVKGEVTKLLPGKSDASPLKVGDILPEDTSVVTGEKSVARIQFADNSSMNLGPKSMVVVSQMPKKQANMINLLTGAIKTEVEKHSTKESSNKMIIKTRSAVMGVRGTKFQAIYNPDNKNTSLITVEGKVAMIKKEESVMHVEKGADLAQNTATNNIGHVASPEEELKALDKELEVSKESVEVPEGRFSSVGNVVEKPTVPVKIAPQQYNAIASSMGVEKKAEEVMQNSATDVDPNGFVDKATGDVAPRAGGMIDFETGLYIPPKEGAKLDEKTGTFQVEEKLGKIDAETGDYIPPKGLELDATKGFVMADAKEGTQVASLEDQQALKQVLSDLNHDVASQSKTISEETLETKGPWWKPEKHVLSFVFLPYSESMDFKPGSGGDGSNFLSDSANYKILRWEQGWNENWRSRLSIGSIDYSLEKSDGVNLEKNTKGGSLLQLQMYRNLSDKFALYGMYSSESVYYAFTSRYSSNTAILNATELNSLRLGVRMQHGKTLGLTWASELDYQHFLEGKISAEDESIKITGSGFNYGLEGVLLFSQSFGASLNTFLGTQNFDADGAEFKKLRLGAGANLYWTL